MIPGLTSVISSQIHCALELTQIFHFPNWLEDSHKRELLARYIEKNTNQNGILFTPIKDLQMFVTPE